MTWPLDRETGKSMATWQRQHLSISCKTGFLGFLGLFTGGRESFSQRVNSIRASSLLAGTELLESLLGVIYLKLSGNPIPQGS